LPTISGNVQLIFVVQAHKNLACAVNMQKCDCC